MDDMIYAPHHLETMDGYTNPLSATYNVVVLRQTVLKIDLHFTDLNHLLDKNIYISQKLHLTTIY